MRIGEPARKHGVPDEDIWHAVRNALRKVTMDDELTMLIGPSRRGSMLEVGMLGIDTDDPVAIHAMPLRSKFYPFLGQGGDMAMRHSDEQINDAAERFEKLADRLDPATAKVEDASDLRTIAEAADAISDAEARLTEAVARARANGRSWNRIAIALGVSRQAARQRYHDKAA